MTFSVLCCCEIFNQRDFANKTPCNHNRTNVRMLVCECTSETGKCGKTPTPTIDSQSNRSKLVPELKTEYGIVDQARKSPQIKGEWQWYGPEGGGDVIYGFNDRQGYCMACWK